MTTPAHTPGDDPDARLARALAEYLAALEAGRPVDRAAFLAARPDQAAELGPLLASVDAVQAVGRSVAGEDLAAGAGPALGEGVAVGEFRVVRAVGRGGMGVVYEAVQEPLGRRVALKVLPALAAADPARRRRFFHEARTAALLQHPHVVPVFAVGEADGVPYIAMQFVDGAPLDRVVRALRRDAGMAAQDEGEDPSVADLLATGLVAGFGGPEPSAPARAGVAAAGYVRRACELTAQAADALAYAHESEVVHRDVKPGNLLLDVAGRLWLADFGLARAGAGSAGVTGGRPGTLRYMSPEQAAGGTVDSRADVYGLGATLYELLALRPPHTAGSDPDLLREVLSADPVPVRRHNPAVPSDLETVVHKAMARDPRDRYQSAAALAADLRRFLAGLPVEARPLTRSQRWRRWAGRRRRPLLAAALALAAGLVLGLSTSTYLVWRAYRSERAERDRADRREGLVRDAAAALAEMETALRHQKGVTPGEKHRAGVRRLKAVLCALADEPGASVADRLEGVRICVRLAEVESGAGNAAGWHAASVEALARLERLRPDAPDDPGVRFEDARLRGFVGHRRREAGDLAGWAAAVREGADLFDRLARDYPDRPYYRNHQGGYLGTLGEYHLDRGDVAAAEAVQREAIAVDEGLRDRFPTGHPLSYMRLVWDWQRMALIRAGAGDPKGAEAALRTAVGYDDRLAREYGGVEPGVRAGTVMARAELGALLLARERHVEAGDYLRMAERDLTKLAADRPTDVAYRSQLAVCRSWLGQLEYLAGRPDAARAAYAAMAAAQDTLPADYERNVILLARGLVPVGGVVDPAGLAAEAKARAGGFDPRTARLVLGFAHLRSGRYPEAVEQLEAAFGDPRAGTADRALAGYGLSTCHARAGRGDAARAAWEAAERLDGLLFATDGRVRVARAEAAAARGDGAPAGRP
ncbi:MAG: serine/threonine-protein kinase [Gemmataceae bacterium]